MWMTVDVLFPTLNSGKALQETLYFGRNLLKPMISCKQISKTNPIICSGFCFGPSACSVRSRSEVAQTRQPFLCNHAIAPIINGFENALQFLHLGMFAPHLVLGQAEPDITTINV